MKFAVTKPTEVVASSADITVRQTSSGVNGTSLQGYFTATYAQIKAKLGKENCDGDGYKVTTEWNIEFIEPDGTKTIVAIYDYKANSPPRYGAYDWHIGGNSQRAVELVHQLFDVKG